MAAMMIPGYPTLAAQSFTIAPVELFMKYLLTLALTGILLLSGCTGQTVQHLPNNLWHDETTQTLTMRYFSFQYHIEPIGREVRIVAEAYPKALALPDWASWYGEGYLSIYLADEEGNVLAMHEQKLAPCPLRRESGLPLEARFDLGTNRDRPLYVSFGYRLTLMDMPPETPSGHKLLVSEGALEEWPRLPG